MDLTNIITQKNEKGSGQYEGGDNKSKKKFIFGGIAILVVVVFIVGMMTAFCFQLP